MWRISDQLRHCLAIAILKEHILQQFDLLSDLLKSFASLVGLELKLIKEIRLVDYMTNVDVELSQLVLNHDFDS